MKFTIGTIVNDWNEYAEMQKTFIGAGFTQNDCEYIALNNVDKNNFCMYSGGNKIISDAKGDYIILAHQDIRVTFDDRKVLEERLRELDQRDQDWAVAGNAGSNEQGKWSLKITDKRGFLWNEGTFPEKVKMVDGNIIIIKRSSLVAFSKDLSGFHYYGWDICLNADIRGYSSYVIDWNVAHLSDGTVDIKFFKAKASFIMKWNRAFSDRNIGSFGHDNVKLTGRGIDGIFIIGSALSAHGKLSIYNDDERFSQLLNTIDSINKKCPSNLKILFDASPDFDQEKIGALNRADVLTIHTGSDPWIAELSRNIRKSEGEAWSLLHMLQFIRENKIKAKRIYKISGRYWLNDHFSLGLEHVGKIALCQSRPTWYSSAHGNFRDENELISIGAERYYNTRLWHFDYSLLDTVIETVKEIAEDCDKYQIDLEHAAYRSFRNMSVVELERIGVSGNIAPNGMYVED